MILCLVPAPAMTPDHIAGAEQATTKTFRLSGRLAVEITIGPTGWTCEWTPVVPQQLTRKEKRAYLKARREMFGRLSDMVGGTVAVLDLDPDGCLHVGDVIEKKE